MKKILLLIIAIVSIYPLLSQSSGGGAKKNFKPVWMSDCEKQLEEYRKDFEVEPGQSIFPFWGKKLREEGYTLPLPMGVGVSFIAMNQTNKISDFKLLISFHL